MRVAGLFAGIGGFEVGMAQAGHESVLLCDVDPNAQAVLRARFPGVPIESDVRDVRGLPQDAEVVAAGFPCTDLSQAGRVAGIFGDQSGLVDEVFRIVSGRLPEWLVIENVQNMLVLGRGQAIRHVTAQLEALGMRWAYRVVDSRFAGVPQRRRRVIIVASRQHDPREVLFADDAGERPVSDYQRDAFGFYWTEGLRGLGWAQDAIPTLKGGSTIGIPSPPGIWVRRAAPGRKLVVPGADDAEALQGFARGWTSVCTGRRTGGVRLKLVGNAVTTGVAQWVGDRLSHPGVPLYEGVEVQPDDPWRSAAWGEAGKRWSIEDASEFPLHRPYQHLTSVVDVSAASPVSRRGAAGFLSRARRAKLRFDEAFLKDVAEHVEAMAEPPLTEAG